MKESLLDYCLRTGQEGLLHQWDPDHNGTLMPEAVSYGSQKKVWWRCERGHQWQAIVKSRVAGCGCPVCAGRVVIPGENDFATSYPQLLAQWHPTLNGTLRPEELMPGTRKKVWWRCEKGHEWQAAVSSRTQGAGCPVCAGKIVIPGENDMASRYPEVAAQWHETKNGILQPQDVSPYSNKRVWWRCEKGHEYRAPVSHRTMRSGGCPYCAGRSVLPGFNDLTTVEPKVAAQWHPTLNLPVMPEMVTAGSHRKVWWQCEEGHVWKAVIYSRTGAGKCGCPVCAGVSKRIPRHRYAAVDERRKITANV